MKTEEILRKIKELKLKKQKLYSNCYLSFNSMKDKEWNVYCSDISIVIQEKEGGSNRLYFYTLDFADMGRLLEEPSLDGIIEIIAKNPHEFEQDLLNVGFVSLAHMKRVASKDISEVIDCGMGYFDKNTSHSFGVAVPADDIDIYNLLWKTFDTRVSHLPDKDHLEQMIKRKEFLIHRNEEGNIDSLLQCQTTPKSYYVNQIINFGDKKTFHDMIKSSMKEYISNGGRYAFAWVDEKNVASLKFFEKYGMREDGVWNTVYIRKQR